MEINNIAKILFTLSVVANLILVPVVGYLLHAKLIKILGVGKYEANAIAFGLFLPVGLIEFVIFLGLIGGIIELWK